MRDTDNVFRDLERCQELQGAAKSAALLALLNRSVALFGHDDPATNDVRAALETHDHILMNRRDQHAQKS